MLVARSIICVALILSALAYERSAVAQELSPDILRIIPGVAEKLHSPNIYDRISVLDKLVTRREGTDLLQLLLPYNLPASDYSVVVQSILAGNLDQADEKSALRTWGKLTHVVQTFKLRELVNPLTKYLPRSSLPIQLAILRTLSELHASESAPQIVTLLESPNEKIRREALRTLVSVRAKEAIPPLVALLQDKDQQQRFYALKSLVELNAKETAADVVKNLEDPQENLRYWALDTLVKFNAREYAPAIWKLTEASQTPQTQMYALAALVSFGETRAIPLAIEKATYGSRRTEMFEFLVTLKATAIVPALVAVLESRTVLGGSTYDVGTDSNIRREIMKYLGQLEAREAIPVLRAYARGRDSNSFLQSGAVETLGILHAKESVNDLLVLLDQPVTDEAATAEVGLALAQIGERRTWRKLIDLAARPACPYRSEIISELNRQLDRELWERIQTLRVPSQGMKSVKTTVEAFDRESGIRMVMAYQPRKDSRPRETVAGDGYPWANTGGIDMTLSYGLQQIIEGLSNYRTPRTYTFILDDKQIRIMSVEQAIEWWRKRF